MYKVFLAGDGNFSGDDPASLPSWDNAGFILAGSEEKAQDALEAIGRIKPDLLVIGPGIRGQDRPALYEKAVAAVPWMGVVAIMEEEDPFFHRPKGLSGLGEYLIGPVTFSQLLQALGRVRTRMEAAGRYWLEVCLCRSGSCCMPEEDQEQERTPSFPFSEPEPLSARTNLREDGVVWRAYQYILENYTNPDLNLRQVADHVSLSNNHFCTIFSQKLGMTFTECLTALRISKAKELLAGTNMKTVDISSLSGYNDPHYFSYLFKKHTGLTPKDFRREARKEKPE